MSLETRYCAGPDETQALGKEWASRLQAGDLVLLSGPLGAGKTLLARGICEGLGLDPHSVLSPTFTIVHEYRGGKIDVFHIDLYRLETLAQIEALGLDEIFDAGGVCLVEWPERLQSMAPERAWKVSLSMDERGGRKVELQAP